jgi:hypothetical protein
MVSATKANPKRCAITVSLSGYTTADKKEYEKMKQYLMNPNDKSSPEKIAISSKNKFAVLDISVEICDGTKKITIPKQYLEYSASSNAEITKSGDLTGEIEETITIYTSPNIHEEDTLWAALNLTIKFKENLVKEMSFPFEAGSFTGTGSGALEGVSMEGIDKIMKDFECAESPTGWGAGYARIGFIKGWPLEVTSWPPP